jgi:hypothetical protein
MSVVTVVSGAAACGGSHTTSAPKPNASEASPAGDIPDTQVYVEYQPPSGAYRLKVPEGWSRAEDATGVSFTDKLNTIRVEIHPAPQPSVASATDELPTLKAAASSFGHARVRLVQRTQGPAVLITYEANSAPDPVTNRVHRDAVERYEFWRNGTEAVITLTSPQGADNVDPWRTVTDSFSWTQ